MFNFFSHLELIIPDEDISTIVTVKEEENKEDPEATTEKSFIILHTDDLRAEKSEKLIFEALHLLFNI